MSLAELGITLSAVNEVSPVLEQITSDAAAMSSTVSDSSLVVNAENLASPILSQVAEDAANTKAAVEASPIIISFAPVEVPAIPPLDVSPIQASLNQVDIAAATMSSGVQAASSNAVGAMGQIGPAATTMGSQVTAAAGSFNTMTTDAEQTTVSLRTCAMGVRSFAMMGTEVTTLALDFGLVDKGTAKYLRTITTMIMLVSSATRAYSFLQTVTGGETAAVTAETTADAAETSTLSASTIAHNIYGAACAFAAMCEDALDISHATFLALTGIGIGIILAAAAAVLVFAASMNSATKSVQGYNTAASQTSGATSGITRAQSQAMSRKGVEGS